MISMAGKQVPPVVARIAIGNGAYVRPLAIVSPNMVIAIAHGGERLRADGALERFILRVNSHVNL